MILPLAAGFKPRHQPLLRPLYFGRPVYALRPIPRVDGLPVPLSPFGRVLNDSPEAVIGKQVAFVEATWGEPLRERV